MKLIELGKISLLLLIVCLFAICAPFSYLRADQKKNVLVLHSYHKGLEWNDRITQGIESALHNRDQDIELYFEYMDTKRIYDRQYLQHLYELYRHKYKNRRFDVIISSDDHAFGFLLEHHRELFPDTPVVFCGVNDFKDSMLVGHNMITGVIELSDIKSTVDVALELQPNIKQIFVIVDKTLSGTAVKKLAMKAIPYFKGAVKFTFLEDLDMSEVLERVKMLPHDSIVLLIAFTTDKSGNTFSLEGSCALISRNSAVPVYSHADSYLGHGIVGGMLDSGDAQGKKAGELALRILHGEKVKDIPVVKKSPNRYEFDHHQMQRFGIKLRSLPKGSNVINRPYSFYSEHKRLVLSVVVGISVLVLIILILSISFINLKRAEEALRESEATARALLNTPTDAMALTDTSGIILDVNETMASSMGRGMDELIGLYGWDLLPQDIADQRKAYSNKVIQSGKLVRFEDERQGIWFDNIFYPIFDPQGKVVKVAVMARDITDRKQAEEALSESEKRYAKAEQIGHFGHYDRNLLEEKGTWSNETYHIFGVNPDQFQPTWENFLNLIHPSDRKFVKSEVETAISQCKTFDYDYRIIRPDGSERFIHSIAEVGFNESGQPTRLVGTVHDITEQLQAEETLRESEEKYRSLVESTEDSIYLIDKNCNYIYMNQKHLSRFDLPRDEILGRNYSEFHSEEATKDFVERIRQVLESGVSSSYEYQSERDGGYFIRTLSSVRKPDGEINAVTVISKDITKHKQAEEDLRDSTEKLSKEHKQRKVLSKRLIELLEKDRRQIAMELHDHIGQTLTSLKMNLEMIHGKLKPGHTELEAQITTAQERAIQSIKDVKSISQGLRPTMIEALGLIPSLRELFNMIQQQTDIEIHFFSQRIPKHFEGEKELAIYRIAQEALNNIIRHAQSKNVFVNLIKKDEKLSLSVEDDGVGFDPDKIMKPSEMKRSLGLLIMRERAVQLDGEFSVESQPGKGTHLLVEIPL